jgi:hypothetical protein
VTRIGRTAWIIAFAPIGFNEVRAVVSGCETFFDLTEDDLNALAAGISRVLRWYELTGYNSFNLALYSGAPERLAWLARASVDDHSDGDAALLPKRRDAHGAFALGIRCRSLARADRRRSARTFRRSLSPAHTSQDFRVVHTKEKSSTGLDWFTPPIYLKEQPLGAGAGYSGHELNGFKETSVSLRPH